MAGRYDFTINQGEDKDRVITWKDANNNPVDLTGATAKLQARLNTTSAVLLELSTENGGIVITALEGKITLVFTSALTSALTFNSVEYQLEVYLPGKTKRLLYGQINISKEIVKNV